MSYISLDRIVEEYKEITGSPISGSGLTISLENNNYREWKSTLLGPKDTSYKGGLFLISIKFPESYPEKAPEVCFLTPLYHLNVNPKAPKSSGDGVESLGHVSIKTLNQWKPEYRMKEVFVYLYALFYTTDLDNPYGVERAEEFRENRAFYEEKIKYFTKKYANPFENHNIKCDRNKDWDFSYNLK